MSDQNRVPLLALRDGMVFPGTYLELRLTDDSQLRMIRDIIDGPGRLAVTLERVRRAGRSAAAPDVHDVVTVARVRHYAPESDGPYVVRLFGERRARVIAERYDGAYREVVVEDLPESHEVGEVETVEREELIDLYRELLEVTGGLDGGRRVEADGVSFETLVNAVPALINLPVAQRQRLLEIDHMVERCRETQRLMRDAIRQVRGD